MPTTLLLEPSHLLTGDLLVGLLCALGVKPSTFEWELGQVDLGAFHLHLEPRAVERERGVHFGIHGGAVHTHEQDADEGTSHEAHGHAHSDDKEPSHHHDGDDHEDAEGALTVAQVRDRFVMSELTDALKARVLGAFDQFCVHEAEALGGDPPELTFDEDSALSVGAQIVCACMSLEELGVRSVSASGSIDDSVAAGILAAYRPAGEAVSAPPDARTGYGIGDAGWLRGVLA